MSFFNSLPVESGTAKAERMVDGTRTDQIDKTGETSETVTAALATAGHTLGGADLDIVLQPLRLAFETKNMKIVELALDCLHVSESLLLIAETFICCYISF